MEKETETEMKYVKPCVVAVLWIGEKGYMEGIDVRTSQTGDPDDDHVKEEESFDEDVWEPKNENVWDKAW
ncbi:MAG: hypothetical protein IJ762_02025 [Bacteroidaceae bacterium]|nr:hypothetical protein [Bacteroidaceae bacterium]